MKNMIIRLLLVGCSCLAIGGQSIELLPVDSYEINELRATRLEHSILNFAVSNDQIILLERNDAGRSISIIETGKGPDGREKITNKLVDVFYEYGRITAYDVQDRTLFFIAGRDYRDILVSYHLDSNKITEMELGRCLPSSISHFANGNLLVIADAMARVIPENEKFYAAYEEVKKNERFHVFLANNTFSEIKPLIARYGNVGRTRRLTNEQVTKGTYYLRMGTLGQLAAVYNRNTPGIRLLNDQGKEVATITHPGMGMVPANSQSEEGVEPMRILYQEDVVIDETGELVLASDIVNAVIWVMSYDNKVLASIKTNFVVIEMAKVGDYLYLRGRDGEFGKFHYPEFNIGKEELDSLKEKARSIE